MRSHDFALVDPLESLLVGPGQLQLRLERGEVLLSSLEVQLLQEEFLLLFLDLLQLLCMHLLEETLLVVELILCLQVQLGKLPQLVLEVFLLRKLMLQQSLLLLKEVLVDLLLLGDQLLLSHLVVLDHLVHSLRVDGWVHWLGQGLGQGKLEPHRVSTRP